MGVKFDVAYTKGKKTEVVWEQGAEGNIWI
jgi:hypothetical protein